MGPPRLPIPSPPAYRDAEISVADAARRLGCSPGVVYYWIETGQLAARRSPGGRLCIPWNDQVQASCRELIAQSARPGRAARRTLPAPPSPAADGEVSVTEAAYQLGCSIHVIYYWINTGKLAARRGPGVLLHPWNEQARPDAAPASTSSGHLNPAARRTKARQRH